MRTAKKTVPTLDLFRLAAVLLVVMNHTSPLADVSAMADFWLTRVLARVAVPFFLMTTGYFLSRNHWAGVGRQLKKLCLHAYAAKKPVKEVAQLRDKYVWTRVDYLLGLTPEKLARAEHEYKVDRIHRLFGLDKKLVDKYMRMGYASHQVKRAMFLAHHCDKSVEELLAMKTRQQKWGDICEQLGLPRDACMK